MKETFEIHADGIGKGLILAEAIVSTEPVSFNNGVEPTNGIVIEPGHQLEGQCVTGKVMVFPVGKGSAGGSYVLYDLAVRKTAPAAIINTRSDTIIVIGCIMGRIPMMHVYLAIGFGVIGYFMRKCDIPRVPVLLGLILGSLMETSFNTTMQISQNDLSYFFTRPLSVIFLLFIPVSIGISAWSSYRKRKKARTLN